MSVNVCAVLAIGGCAASLFNDAYPANGAHEGLSFETTSSAPLLGETSLDQSATLEQLLQYAALNNAGLKAAFEQWKAALEQVVQATTLPDPQFNYKYFIENIETRVGPQRHMFGLSQTFPWFGKLADRGGIAMETANAAKARYDARKLRLFYNVKQQYYEYYYLSRAVAVVHENRELVKYLEQVARTRFKAATTSHPDVIRAQVELGKLDDQLRTLKDMRRPVAAQLNAALSRPGDALLPEPKAVDSPSLTVDDAQLVDWLGQNNPELKALQSAIAGSRRSVSLAHKDRYPNVTLGIDYVEVGPAIKSGLSDSGQDAVSFGVSVNLPIWQEKYNASHRQALHRFGAATQQRVDREHLLEAKLRTVLFHLRDAHRKIDLYRDTLLPKARQAIKATETAFRAGSATFSDFVDAQRVLLQFELELERANVNNAQRYAQVEMLVGRDITDKQEVHNDGQ